MAHADTIERFSWPGQGLSLDLADTVVVVRPAYLIDHLETERDVRHWLDEAADQLGHVESEGLLDDLRTLRSAIRSLFRAIVNSAPLDIDAVTVLNEAAAAVRWERRLITVPEPSAEWVPTAAPRQQAALAAIADHAITLIGGDRAADLRICHAPACGMFFLAADARQTWCRPACGNRARAARAYARRRRT